MSTKELGPVGQLLDKPEAWGHDYGDGGLCIMQAICRCYPDFDKRLTIYSRLVDSIGRDVRRFPMSQLIDWNDAPERTFDDVRKLLEETGI